MDKLVSVIVPVYKVEQFLERCICSLVHQTYQNLEIILVDDGSPDRCPEICEEWAAEDGRIKVVHKKNAGLGYARNTGMDHVTGDYLFFIDSDDYIALDTIERVMEVADRTGAEMVQFGHFLVGNSGKVKRKSIPKAKKEVYRGEEIRDVILPNMIVGDLHGAKMHLSLGVWSKAYSYDLIRRSGWKFASEREIISEDFYSLLCLMKDVQSFAIVSEAFYFYCINDNSLSHTYRPDRFIQQKKLYKACMKVCEEAVYSQEVKERIAHMYMNGNIGVLRFHCIADMPVKDKKQAVREVICDNNLQQTLHHMNIRKEPFKKRLLYYAMRQRWIGVTYLLLQVRYGRR